MQRQLLAPARRVDAGHERVTSRVEVEAGPVEVLIARRQAEGIQLARGLALDPLDDPAQHAHVLAVAGPDELAVGAFSE